MASPVERRAQLTRTTKETLVRIAINVDGSGQADIRVPVGFFRHMLELFARHSLIDLTVEAQGDTHVDPHHTVEDVGICLGLALREALGKKEGVVRYGDCRLPMEECLISAAVDLGGRPYFVYRGPRFSAEKIGDFPSELVVDFWHAVATHVPCNLHIWVHYGRNSHHLAEGVFKAVARAIRQAVALDPREQGIPSTKGVL
ncbi:MAG: imidazoleglycerol-phosphate dehydratase HisB [Thermoguttaceae bacterium]|nr:imidazoleglycerol-phosphate dehydratase HisB [Thermoguttaceae bacterium]MDW8077357.1 imidazoleglycerol-phosphate dehydratase HisB [Thermoguttaceae bacterium]